MVRLLLLAVVALLVAFVPMSCHVTGVKVGSKKMTESVILGEAVTYLARDTGTAAKHYRELGGTQLVFQSLVNGDIDIYPEYTGTITAEIFGDRAIESDEQLRAALLEQGVLMSRPLGFNNSYAIGMVRERAEQLDVERISDLAKHPDLQFGFSNEFMDRKDGWPGLKDAYGLPHRNVNGLDHDLAYRQLRYGAIDAIDVYTTDAKIQRLDLKVLQDDRKYFPRYDAVILYRADLADKRPGVVKSILRLEGEISEAEMIEANGAAEEGKLTESHIAADMLKDRFGLEIAVAQKTVAGRIWVRTLEHLDLVRKSLIPAILFAVPLGIVAAKLPRLGQVILALAGVIQTIPALALLVLLLVPVAALGLASVGGWVTAVTALFLYSLLPIIRNTHSGLQSIGREYQESAAALGLPAGFRCIKIELPLASRSILAGIKTAAVINVGFATLGALIGAGGYGQPILTGIRLFDTGLILQGAIPAAVLALVIQGMFEAAERGLVPKGLRVKEG